MALHPTIKCKICNIIKQEKSPATDTYSRSPLYMQMARYKQRLVTAEQIILKYPSLNKDNISLHCKKHQSLSERAAAKIRVAVATTKEFKAELSELRKRVSNIEQTKSDTSKLIDNLMAEVEAGNIQGKFSDLVKLLQQESKIHEKEKDQGISMMGLMAKYSSGELERKDAPRDAS